MKKVYIVTTGEYSDYRINAVFSTEEKADGYRENFQCDNVDTYDLDPSIIPFNNITIGMARNGGVVSTSSSISIEEPAGFWCFGTKGSLVWEVNTHDKKKAIKIVNDKRIKILTYGCWGDDEKVRMLEESKNL